MLWAPLPIIPFTTTSTLNGDRYGSCTSLWSHKTHRTLSVNLKRKRKKIIIRLSQQVRYSQAYTFFRLLVFIRSSVPLSISYTHYLFCVPRVLSANQVTILRHWIIFGKLNHCISLSEFPKCPSALNFILFYNIFLTHSVGKLTLSFSIFIKLINSLLF